MNKHSFIATIVSILILAAFPLAEQGGISRLIVGAHWASDVAAGKMVAASVYEYLFIYP